jgi:gluconolactonase
MTATTLLPAALRYTLPAALTTPRASTWAAVNMRGSPTGCFLEGPSFDIEGNLLVVDIPFGRIFRVPASGEWQLICEYDGWPNGLKIHRDGTIYIADYRRGILRLSPDANAPEEFVCTYRSEGFKGCNDLFFSGTGDLYFTDQGQTGLHDPTGRVFCADRDGQLSLVAERIPSPNGLVMNTEGSQLLVAATRANAIWRFPLMEDGSASKVGVFIQLSGGIAGPDGLAVDVEGGVVACHPGIGVWRFDKMGRPTHLVEAPPQSVWTNIAFGGDQNRELFITDSIAGSIWSVLMPYSGVPMYSHN